MRGLGHSKLESTARSLASDVDDAIALAEQTDFQTRAIAQAPDLDVRHWLMAGTGGSSTERSESSIRRHSRLLYTAWISLPPTATLLDEGDRD